MKCNNCKATLTCGCQKKVASNGANVCGNCISSYEANLKKIKLARP
jgi:hypothetical protein